LSLPQRGPGIGQLLAIVFPDHPQHFQRVNRRKPTEPTRRVDRARGRPLAGLRAGSRRQESEPHVGLDGQPAYPAGGLVDPRFGGLLVGPDVGLRSPGGLEPGRRQGHGLLAGCQRGSGLGIVLDGVQL
jgi:hypothetical protein